jgi:hypothetical protein
MPAVKFLRFYKISLALVGACIAIFIAAQTRAAGFRCPVAHGRTNNLAIQETPAQVAQLSNELAVDETGNTTIATIMGLKRKYPKARFDEIVNYIVTAYCPIVAKNASLSDEEKEDRLKRYSLQIGALAIE